MKLLAAQADARWASKPSALDAPDKQQPMQMLKSRDPDSGVGQMNVNQEIRDRAKPPPTMEEPELGTEPVIKNIEAQHMPQDPPEATNAEDVPSVPTRKRIKKDPSLVKKQNDFTMQENFYSISYGIVVMSDIC